MVPKCWNEHVGILDFEKKKKTLEQKDRNGIKREVLEEFRNEHTEEENISRKGNIDEEKRNKIKKQENKE